MQIEETSDTKRTVIEFLNQKLNEETPEFGEMKPFAFCIRDDKDQIIAGASGLIIFGSVYTGQLWVNKNHRGKGLGKKLMERVHDYGRSLGFTIAAIDTMSFHNAVEFYQKLGYVVEFERDHYANDSSCIFLHKIL